MFQLKYQICFVSTPRFYLGWLKKAWMAENHQKTQIQATFRRGLNISDQFSSSLHQNADLEARIKPWSVSFWHLKPNTQQKSEQLQLEILLWLFNSPKESSKPGQHVDLHQFIEVRHALNNFEILTRLKTHTWGQFRLIFNTLTLWSQAKWFHGTATPQTLRLRQWFQRHEISQNLAWWNMT